MNYNKTEIQTLTKENEMKPMNDSLLVVELNFAITLILNINPSQFIYFCIIFLYCLEKHTNITHTHTHTHIHKILKSHNGFESILPKTACGGGSASKVR